MSATTTTGNPSKRAPLCPWAQAALRFPECPAILDSTGHPVSWAALNASIENARSRLETKRGKAVALVASNQPADIILLVAALRDGWDVALFGPRTPRAVIEDDAAALDATLLDASHASIVGPESFSPSSETPIRLSGHTLIRTSGTTGGARWIRHTADAHLSSAARATERLGLVQQDAWGWCLPMHHVGGLSILWRCALVGASVLCPPSHLSLATWLGQGTETRRPTHLSVVPTQLRDIVQAGRTPAPTFRSIIVGGAHVSAKLLADAMAAGWPIRTTYGMTETASMITLSDVWTEKPEGHVHAGTPFDGVDIEAPAGRIRVRSATLGTEVAAPDGWLVTSDSGFQDTAGRWVISGRTDRIIISGGENLDPDRIERAIRSLDSVDECVVVAVADSRYGQRPVAFVSGPTPLPDRSEMVAQLRDRLVSFEIPDAFHAMPALEPGQTKWSRSALEALAAQADR